MNNILYLDDYINFYNNDVNKIIKITPYKGTLRNGIIIERNKFIKKMIKELNKIGIKNSLFNNSMTIIINNLYTKEDKLILKEVMEELNYKNVVFIQELNYLDINKNKLFINCNYEYYYILFTDMYGNTELNIYKNDVYNKSIFINLIDSFYERDIILYGKNTGEFERILNVYKKDYYVYEEKDNLVMHMLLNNCKS